VLLIGVHLLGVAIAPGAVVFLYAVSLGATGGAVRACLSTMQPGYFGTDHIGSIQGIMTLTGVIGSALGPVTLALAESRFGSYQSANLVLMTLPVATLLVTFTNRST
jgi:MFS-type transporter involved in bile tolerance (Atg22 family)